MRCALLLVTTACWSGGGTSSPPSRSAPPPEWSSDIPAAGDACAVDRDCVVTNLARCCTCPGCDMEKPTARSRAALARIFDGCKPCDPHRCDELADLICGQSESADHFEARCSRGTCVGVRLVPRE